MTIHNTVRLRQERKCFVCGEPAHSFSPNSEPVCLRAECRLVLNRKKQLSDFSYKQFFSLQSVQIKKTIELVELKKKRLAEKREMENSENFSCWEKAINPDCGYDPEHYPYVVVPSNLKKITRLPKKRKTIFLKTLYHLINESLLESGENQDENSRQNEPLKNDSPFEAKACSICSGGCCCIGEEHAFLKKETIFHYMSGHPDQTPAQVVAAYMKYLPEKSFENSCVNHTKTGCTLPRDMRSHVCNNYLCAPLNKLRKLFAQTPLPKGVFFISRAQNNWKKDDPDFDNRIVGSVLISRGDLC
ncbi:MAG: hypothetical protein GY860_17660 [Desulfobacteraceae bacterium]|nr:hypothetical protein [Desulfobacteraceae bacterium]